MIHYIGLDCHRKSIRACRMDTHGNVLDVADIATTHDALRAYAALHLSKEDTAVLECSFYSRSIARLLRPLVNRVIVSNPLATKLIAQSKKKTDKVDARVLADLARLDYLPEVWMPDNATEARRDLCARRCSLISESTRVKNRIHSVLAAALIPVEVSDLFGVKGRTWLNTLKQLDPDERAAIESDHRQLEAIEAD